MKKKEKVTCSRTGLPLHGADAGVLEKQPVVHFVPFAGTLSKADFVIRVVALDQVLHYAA